MPCLPLVAFKGHSRQAFSSRRTPFSQFCGGKTLTKRAVLWPRFEVLGITNLIVIFLFRARERALFYFWECILGRKSMRMKYVFGEAKETCLVNPLPSGARLKRPIHARDGKTRDMYAMLEKKKNHHPFFSGDIKKMCSATKCKWMWREYLRFFHVLCRDIVDSGCWFHQGPHFSCLET